MLLLIYTSEYHVLKYDFESNCSWISKLPDTKLIGEVKIFKNHPDKLISISTLISPYYAVHFCNKYAVSNRYAANYNYLKFIPKEIMKFCIAAWKVDISCLRSNFLEENLDKIYDELVIKDIIE
jgi:hypothetical protein